MAPLTWFTFLVLPLALADLRGAEPQDWQKAVNDAAWEWKADEASVWHSIEAYQGDYQLELVKKPERRDDYTLRVVKEGKEVLTLPANSSSTFVIDGDRLYFADYHPSASGCALAAFDLKTGKQLWQTPLQGLGPIQHFRYSNRVALDLAAPGVIRVRGHESAGDYVEYVDASGKTVAHRRFR